MLNSEELSHGIQNTLTIPDKQATGTKGVLNGLLYLH